MENKELGSFGQMDEYYDVIKDALIKAKKKETSAEKKMIRSGVFILALLLAGAAYIFYLTQIVGYTSSYLSFILSDPLLAFWILVIFISYFYFLEKTKKYEKKEKDFDELKEDIIDRSSDIWNSEELKVVFFEELKRNHDINLYHK